MNFTHLNHLKYHIGSTLYGFRTSPIEKYQVQVGKIDINYYKSSNYRTELLRTADLIYNDYGTQFALFLSGGTDSEIVLRSFLDIGIKPQCYTIKFKDDDNLNDVNEAIYLAKEFDISLNIIDFDVKDFLYSGKAIDFGKKLQCTQITYLMVYYCILEIQLPAVMGGELLLRRNINTNPSTWYYCFRENEDASAIRFSQQYNLPLVNEYFSYTPELMLYYLEDPDIQQLVNIKYNFKLSSVSSKNNILRKFVPEIKLRTKTHGFEKLLNFNFEAYRKLASEQILRLENNLDGIEYYKIINMLKGKNEDSKTKSI